MKENLSKPITKHCMEIILNQMNNSICWINQEKNKYEIGFFINFKYRKKVIPVLLTKFDIIDRYNNNFLNISLKNKDQIIKLANKRYRNKDYNIALVEIIRNKNDDIQLLEINENLFKDDLEINCYNESIYAIQYNNKKELSISFGKIKGIIKEKINYSCYINSNSNIVPIFDIASNKIIGMHEKISNFYNKGILLKEIIKAFFFECKSVINGINEINLTIKIDKNEIKKHIYFIDNYDNNHSNLKELNNLNTELYINNYKYEYNKYFEPKNEGIYNIKLKFNFNLKECGYMFAKCKNIINIDFTNFITKDIINMEYICFIIVI